MKYIELLKNYNAWRRGDDNIEQPHPTEIGKAIDWAVDTLTRLDKWKNMNNMELRLQCGDLTYEQAKIIRSVLNVIYPNTPISNQTKQ